MKWKTFSIPKFPAPVEAPEHWSATAVEIAATKYFRRDERSVRQLVDRVVGALRAAGEAQGHFGGARAQAFADDLSEILLAQRASFNSPVYFNVGLYARPQGSACFIQDVQDDLGSIFDLLKSEARLFKFGSGTGTNFSRLRAKGEALDSGGVSTGLISYLEIFDKAAHAIKSGGTNRRAAKMVVLDADHPEVMEFIRWKMLEERKARVLLANGYSGGMEGEAFGTVSGQNSNNSVRVSDEFLERALNGGKWSLTARRDGRVMKELPAQEILREMARAAWECADPGIQFRDTIQRWHMCPNAGEIRSSNPCSEYMFLDNSACNLASLNLVSFLNADATDLDWEAFRKTVGTMLLAQEILVDFSSYPTPAIADNSHRFRPLGLGYANLGALLMRMGIPYDSELAAEWTAKITGALHASALHCSAEMAAVRGAFAGWVEDAGAGMRVLEMHAQAWRERKLNMPWVDELFSKVLKSAEKTGLRNAQVTLLAPTGTIGLLMDCDTLGIEPDFSLSKRKTLSGGGELLLTNRSVIPALRKLGYSPTQIEAIVKHTTRHGHPVGAPEFKPEHAPVFDCAVAPRECPERRISPHGHLRIMAAAQPFLSGAISKTVNLPSSATVGDIEKLFIEGWRLGLKALAVYRDGSKALQPLCAEC